MENMQSLYVKFCEISDTLNRKYADHDITSLRNTTASIKSKWEDVKERYVAFLSLLIFAYFVLFYQHLMPNLVDMKRHYYAYIKYTCHS